MENVTVVIPLYNKEKHILRSVRSVLDQTVQSFEIVIVDDGSTDQGAAVVQGIPDPRIRLIRQENQGVSAARNHGVRESSHALIAFLDADDAWKPDFLETVLALHAKYPDAGAFATDYETSTGGSVKPVRHLAIPPHPWSGILPDFFASMLGQPPVWTSAVLVKRQVFEAIGGFQVGEVIAEDVDLWCRIALKYPIAYDTKVCATYYLDSENRCYVRGKKNKKANGYLKTLNGALKDTSLPSDRWHNISVLVEMVELGYATSLIFGKESREARKAMSTFHFVHLKKKKNLWYLLSYLPVRWLERLMDAKSSWGR